MSELINIKYRVIEDGFNKFSIEYFDTIKNKWTSGLLIKKFDTLEDAITEIRAMQEITRKSRIFKIVWESE